jgi:hypothetical protein
MQVKYFSRSAGEGIISDIQPLLAAAGGPYDQIGTGGADNRSPYADFRDETWSGRQKARGGVEATRIFSRSIQKTLKKT